MEKQPEISEALCRTLIESSNDCIKILDLEGRLRFMNDAGQRQLCIKDLDPFLTLPYTTFWGGGDQEEALRAMSSAREGGKGRFTGYAATVDGDPRWWDVVISPIRGADGKVERLLAVSRDVTEHRQAEEALRTLVETMAGLTGQAYFDKVTTALCRWFCGNGASISVLEPGDRFRTISMVLNGQKVPDHVCSVLGTPCEKVITTGACLLSRNAGLTFFDDQEQIMEGYAGAPIRDQTGRVIGVIWVVSRKPLEPPGQWEAMLSITAAKTSAEIERTQAEAALSRRLETEKLVTAISARFINVRPAELDQAINSSLRLIGEFSDVDRCYLFQFSTDGSTMENTHEWCAPGIKPHIDELQGLSVEHFGYSMSKMRAGETFHVPLVVALPPEAGPEIREFESEGIRSLINVPVRIGGVTAGFLGFDMVRETKAWTEQDQRIIRLVGEIFAMALERKRFEEDTQRSLREKEVLLREIHHRVKNNMQIISSLLMLQSSRTNNREIVTVLEDARRRVQAMALAHERLYRTDDLTFINLREYLAGLLHTIRTTFAPENPEIRLEEEIEDVSTDMDQAIPIGLLVNELVSNAVKHAYPRGGPGTIIVKLAVMDGDTISLTVADDGVGLPEGLEWKDVPTLGLTLISELTSQLRGEAQLLEQESGTGFCINLKRVRE